ncbi:MAG: hypothetical protein GY853_07765 [PVC group bacterium]|nr:hypothetical protein [PVC group bacterium]
MGKFLPLSFTQLVAGIFSFCSIIAFFLSLKTSIRAHSLRLFSISLISALSLFCNHVSVYFASVFIIATAITETEFLQNLAAIISDSKEYFHYKQAKEGKTSLDKISSTEGTIKITKKETISLVRDPIEYKILNTLFTKQVNKFPTFSPLFTFIISRNSFEYPKFREMGSKLYGEGLIGETENGHYCLTQTGWEWCKKHYDDFKSSPQWWSEEPIIVENLKKVLEQK